VAGVHALTSRGSYSLGSGVSVVTQNITSDEVHLGRAAVDGLPVIGTILALKDVLQCR